MSDRQTAIEAVTHMPESASMAEIVDELRMLASVREGFEESECGEGLSHQHVAQLLDEWITKSSGRHAA